MTAEPGPGPADDTISKLVADFHEEAARGVSSRSDFEALKGRYLGREKGLVPALFARMREIPAADRASYGARANAAKREIEEAIARLGDLVARGEAEKSERAAAVDVTLPGTPGARRFSPPGHDRSAAGRGNLPPDGLLDRRRARDRKRRPQLRGAQLPARAPGARRAGHSLPRPQGAVAPTPAHAHVARPDPGDEEARRADQDHLARPRLSKRIGGCHAPARLSPGRSARRRPGDLDGGPEGDRRGLLRGALRTRDAAPGSSPRSSRSSSRAPTCT